jgi:AcrR family transcriptional regulator
VARIEQQLLTVALDEFREHGYGAASMNAIASAAHVSKTTLYSRFPSKGSLFRALMQQQIDQLAASHPFQLTRRDTDLTAGLTAYANFMLDLSSKGDALQLNRLIYSESSRFPELGAAAAQRTRQGISEVANFIRQCAAASNRRCRNADSVAEAFIFMIRGWYIDVMLTNRQVFAAERERWVERVVHVLVASQADW